MPPILATLQIPVAKYQNPSPQLRGIRGTESFAVPKPKERSCCERSSHEPTCSMLHIEQIGPIQQICPIRHIGPIWPFRFVFF
ncbi:hypothetical protein QZG57_02150 [Corynebacterium glucuronolyticum]|uniref:hypothetical protein n=1 Tax=Corynebacterium glucuronolyticum TaxID=39791 RepID=UPI003F6DEECD